MAAGCCSRSSHKPPVFRAASGAAASGFAAIGQDTPQETRYHRTPTGQPAARETSISLLVQTAVFAPAFVFITIFQAPGFTAVLSTMSASVPIL